MGNKISVKDKFEKFITEVSPEIIITSLKTFLTERLTDDDVKFGLLPSLVRNYIEKNPEGAKLTVTECINHVFYMANSEKIPTWQEIIYLNNTLLFLARFLPILNEAGYQELTSKLLWAKTNFPADKTGEIKQGTSVLEECLQIKLLYSLFKLMFLPEYTIATTKVPSINRYNVSGITTDKRLAWKNFDNTSNPNDQYKFYFNRLKVLECLLSCVSAPVGNAIHDRADPIILYCVSPHNKLIGEALCAFLCFGMSYEENGRLPYTQYIATDPAGNKLTMLCIQLFLLFTDIRIVDEAIYDRVMNDIRFQAIAEHFLKIRDNKLTVEPLEFNNIQTCREIFQNTSEIFIRELKLTEVYVFITQHTLRILRNPYHAENTYLLESKKRTSYLEEGLLIFYRFVELNPTYIQRLYYQKECLQIMVYLLYQIHEKFQTAARSNIFYIAVILLSKLSCDRYFTVQLKQQFTNDIGFTRVPIFIGTHIDLVFIIFLNGMVDSYLKGYFCYQNNLLAILHNIAPFAKNVAPMTATLLFQFIKAVANPKTLQQDKNNLIILRKGLNLVHKILCYQPETCETVLYELLSQKKELESLKRLPLKKIYGIASPPATDSKKVDPNISAQIANLPDADRVLSDSMVQHRSRDEEEKKQGDEEIQPKNIPKKLGQPVEKPMELFDEAWMRLFMQNINHDLIFVVANYLQDQLRNIFREKDWNSEDEVKKFLSEQSILGIVPPAGHIMVEVVNDPININNNLYIFLWQQILLKSQGLPYFDAQDVRLLNAS